MPPRTAREIPKMSRHPSGQARVRLNGLDHYLGRWGSRDTAARYDALIEAWLANGRRPLRRVDPCGTVEELCERYSRFVQKHFVKAGRRTSTVPQTMRALELLYRAGLTDMAPNDFGPLDLKAFQKYLVGDPHKRWSRKTANERVAAIVSMFKWGVSEQLIRADVWRALTAVRPLAKGRTALRESRPVHPVDRSVLRRTRRHLPPAVRAMVDIQLLTGMRPTELVHLRRDDLEPTRDKRVMRYVVKPEGNKLDHLEGRQRVVYFGPRALRVMRPWLNQAGPGYVFSPRASEIIRNAARRAARKTRRWGSHDPELRRGRRGTESRAGERYTVDSYRRAIERACMREFGLDQHGGARERWAPNQLRHTAATVISDREAIHVAQAVLGHADLSTTQIYVKARERKAMAAAIRHG